MKISEEISISDNGFVFNPNTGDSFNLNPSALKIINLLAAKLEIDEIKNAFLEEFDVAELTFEKDFYEFLTLLKYHGIMISVTNSDFN